MTETVNLAVKRSHGEAERIRSWFRKFRETDLMCRLQPQASRETSNSTTYGDSTQPSQLGSADTGEAGTDFPIKPSSSCKTGTEQDYTYMLIELNEDDGTVHSCNGNSIFHGALSGSVVH